MAEEEITEEVIEEKPVIETEEIVEQPTEEVVEEPIEDPPKKPKKTIDERLAEISSSTWEMRESERKANQATERAETAIKKLEAMTEKVGDPKPDQDDFESTEDWVEALTDWKIKYNGTQKTEVKKKPESPQNENALRNWNFRKEKAVTKYKDFAKNEDMVTRILNHYGNRDVTTLLIESEIGPELVNHLGKNTDKLERIAQLSSISAAKEIGRLEDDLSRVSKKRTNAPRPITPSGGGGGGTVSKEYSDMSDADFQRKRNEELHGKR